MIGRSPTNEIQPMKSSKRKFEQNQPSKRQKVESMELPSDILLSILSFLPLKYCLKLRSFAISKHFHECLSSNVLWGPLLQQIQKHIPQVKLPKWQLISQALSGELDEKIVSEIAVGECFYGSTTSYLKPYIREIPTSLSNIWPLTAKHVLQAMGLEKWASIHIKDLNKTFLKYPGYHPHTINDEIHTEVEHNYIVPRSGDSENFKALKQYVRDGIVWFVLYHTDEVKREVHLYAVGRSPFTNCLVGTHATQLCHNLCD